MEQLRRFLGEELNINNEDVIGRFSLYNELILNRNKKINLISRKQKNIEKNILDSLFFLTKHQFKGDENIIDVGTGGGFPGIPLKIIYSGLRLTLLDSTQKKINAVKDIITVMGLNDTDAVWGRAEEKSGYREFKGKYDIVITLAVSSLANIYKWCKDFLKKKGYIICLKGGDIGNELKELDRLKVYTDVTLINYAFENFPGNLTDKKAVIIKNLYK